MDNHLTFDQLKIDGLDKASGTYAFGINGLKVMFGGFIVNVVRSDFKIKKDGSKSKDDKSSGDSSEDKTDVLARKAENSKDYGRTFCLNANTKRKRMQFCDLEITDIYSEQKP